MKIAIRNAIAISLSSLILGCQTTPSAPGNSASNAASETIPTQKTTTQKSEGLPNCIQEAALDRIVTLGNSPQSDPQKTYYVTFSTQDLEDPKDIGKVKSFLTLSTLNDQCETLSKEEAIALAQEFFKLDYVSEYPLEKGRVDATWGNVVNRWERDHYVLGPGDHPLVLGIRDVWIARTLDLSLPDYVPIYISQ